MKINLYSNDEDLGEIILGKGSKITREFRGILLPTENYFERRFLINEFFTKYQFRTNKTLTDKIINKIDKTGTQIINQFHELNLRIFSREICLIDEKSKLQIQDTLIKTSKGNSFVQIDAEKLDIPSNFPEFELFQIEWLHPAELGGTIGIKKNDKIIFEY